MRAAVFHEVGRKLAIEARQRPVAESGGLVLKVAYAGICGSDIHATEKSLAPLEPGTVLGHEFAGVVVESGDPAWVPGDRVIGVPLRECEACREAGACREGVGILCGRNRIVGMSAAVPGAYVEFVALGARHALRVPGGVGLREAALAEPLAVGAHAVRLAGEVAGRDVLVVGAGPIGLAVVAFAARAGARRIAVSEIDPVRRARAERFGARVLIDPAGRRLAEAASAAGMGAPGVVFECVGVPGLIQHCIELAPLHGQVVVVGVNRGEDVIVPRMAIRKELVLRFVLGYQQEDFAAVLAALAAGQVDAGAMVSRVIGLDALPDMFEALRGPNPEAKVLIDPSR